MADPGKKRFREALAMYEEAALPELGALRTLDVVRLIERVEGCLDGGGVLYATRQELEAAVRVVLAQADDPGSFDLLSAELARFRDLAVEHGLVARSSRQGEPVGATAAPTPGAASPEDVARVLSRLVASAIEEGLHSALLVNPVAATAYALGERRSALDQSAELLGNRWRSLASRLEKPLDLFRIAFPILALVIALNSLFSCSGPLGSRTKSAVATGAGVNQMKKLVRKLHAGIGDPSTIETLEELEQRSGLPTDQAARVFRLRRVRWDAVYLEHTESGKLVVVTGDYVGSFDSKGTWRFVK